MKTTHHSEYLKLKSVYIKPVTNAFVSQNSLNEQWEALNYLSQPNFEKSKNEYKAFQKCLEKEGVELRFFPLDDKVKIDSIYCRDASIATDFGMILCNMGKKGRVNEPKSHLKEYKKQVINVLGAIQHPGTIEGGDVAWIDDKTIAVGHTYRTNSAGISQLKAFITTQRN